MSYSKSYEPETYAQGGYGQQTQPVNAVGNYGDSIPVVAQPTQQAYSGGAWVPPHGGQQQYGGQQGAPDQYGPRQRRQPPPIGKWADGICDWPSNLYPSAYCVCCACSGAWILGQISEKVGCMKFKYTVGIYFLLQVLAFILQLAVPVSQAIIWLPYLYIFIHIIIVRVYIVKHHQIQECSTNPGCAQFGECCWGFWCNCCSLCQMARYVYGYDQVFDGDGDPYRGDNWAV